MKVASCCIACPKSLQSSLFGLLFCSLLSAHEWIFHPTPKPLQPFVAYHNILCQTSKWSRKLPRLRSLTLLQALGPSVVRLTTNKRTESGTHSLCCHVLVRASALPRECDPLHYYHLNLILHKKARSLTTRKGFGSGSGFSTTTYPAATPHSLPQARTPRHHTHTHPHNAQTPASHLGLVLDLNRSPQLILYLL